MKSVLATVIVMISLASSQILVCEDAKPASRSAVDIVTETGQKASFTSEQLAKLPQTELTVKDRRGEEARYSGVLLSTLLKEAGAATGAELKGKLLANHLLVEAADDYRVAFSLPEIDAAWTDHVVLLATTRNGEPLAATHGPFQIVISGEKLHSRWVKQVVRLTVKSGKE